MDVVNPRFGPMKSFEPPALSGRLMVRMGSEAYLCQVLLNGDGSTETFERLRKEIGRLPFGLELDENQSGNQQTANLTTFRAVPAEGYILFVQFIDSRKTDPQSPLIVQMAVVPEE